MQRVRAKPHLDQPLKWEPNCNLIRLNLTIPFWNCSWHFFTLLLKEEEYKFKRIYSFTLNFMTSGGTKFAEGIKGIFYKSVLNFFIHSLFFIAINPVSKPPATDVLNRKLGFAREKTMLNWCKVFTKPLQASAQAPIFSNYKYVHFKRWFTGH